ncbi:ABC-2 transporter permease [Anaerostipes sp.]|uniref:ABC-2 transporter permease n=1 Tax=Anaerostipes sp. TaxID=1872530 RepID=UPI0025C46AFE|nr:ABC-2 transporter permease [Anaerostipes sp.]MBS7008243.1 ABC-2 transporter permease [Anaerostipes sp.]
MKGLLRKEILLLQSYVKNLTLVVIMFTVISFINESYAFLASALPCMFSILCFSLISYDDYYHWDAYSLTLPIEPRDCVRCKFIISSALLALGTALGIILSLVIVMVKQVPIVYEEIFYTAYAGICIGLLLMSLMYPIAYRFGTEKGRFVMFGVFASISVVIVALGKAVLSLGLPVKSILEFFEGGGKFLPVPIVLLLAFISYRISCSIFLKKEY